MSSRSNFGILPPADGLASQIPYNDLSAPPPDEDNGSRSPSSGTKTRLDPRDGPNWRPFQHNIPLLLTFSQLNPMVGAVLTYWLNLSLYSTVVFPAESRPIMAQWKDPRCGRCGRRSARPPTSPPPPSRLVPAPMADRRRGTGTSDTLDTRDRITECPSSWCTTLCFCLLPSLFLPSERLTVALLPSFPPVAVLFSPLSCVSVRPPFLVGSNVVLRR